MENYSYWGISLKRRLLIPLLWYLSLEQLIKQQVLTQVLEQYPKNFLRINSLTKSNIGNIIWLGQNLSNIYSS